MSADRLLTRQHGCGADGVGEDQLLFWRARHLRGLELIHGAHYDHAYPRHTHDEFTISIITQGAQTLRIGGETFELGVGSLITLNPGQPHSNSSRGGYAFRSFYVPSELMLDLQSGSGPPRFESPTTFQSPFFLPLLRLHKLLAKDRTAAEQRGTFVRLFRQILAQQPAYGGTPPAHCGEHQAVRATRKYLEDRFMDTVRLDHLSRVAKLSPFHLMRTFSDQVGMSPAEYQTALRLSHARRLLRQGCPIAAVAADAGFADQSHFTRRFKNAMGVTPGQYISTA